MANVIDQTPWWGASVWDERCDVRFEINRPTDREDLWSSYLCGAAASYRKYGVEAALLLPSICTGATTKLFIVGIDSNGSVISGLRVQGPLRSSLDAHITEEFSGSSVVRTIIDDVVPYGVIEIKGCWVDSTPENRSAVSDALARCYVHAMDVLGVRFACCSVAAHALRRWQSTGGQLVRGLAPVPYPDDRYQTVMLWWDRTVVPSLADPEQLRQIQRESEQLRLWRQEEHHEEASQQELVLAGGIAA
jgi:hypothetical protein